jgi:hypothetical protein
MRIRGWMAGLALAGIALAVTGYGYWHAATHATFEVQLNYRTAPGITARMRNGQLSFLDGDGAVLARASIDTRRGVVWLAHPDKGQCGPALEREAYLECIRAQSEWIPQWAHRVRHANIELENCNVARVPINLYSRRDNAVVWWSPLDEKRGRPYTRHRATLTMDTRRCN